MGLVKFVLTLPFAPVRGVVAVAEIVYRQAEEELYGSARMRADLEEIEDRRRAGLITDAEAARAEQEVVDRMINAPRPAR